MKVLTRSRKVMLGTDTPKPDQATAMRIRQNAGERKVDTKQRADAAVSKPLTVLTCSNIA